MTKKAEIIVVGSELLGPFRSDTNSLFLTKTLEDRGIQVIAKSIIGDDLNDLKAAFHNAFQRSDVVITSGGLGPTQDDLTKEALADYLQLPLELHMDILEGIRTRLESLGMQMPEINRKQAMVPLGATVLPNNNGSAPGFYVEAPDKQIFLLPGPPFELEPMWLDFALPLLRSDESLQRVLFRIAMLPESQVEEMLKPVTAELRDVKYTILASPSEIEIHLLGPQSSQEELVSAAAEVRAILGDKIFAEDSSTLEEVVGALLKRLNKTVSAAESCTGGLLAERFTRVAGSSAYFDRCFVTYSNRAKIEHLAVPAELIESNGAVSDPVAAAMADGIRRVSGSDYGISITGIAGPDGGTADKPVGTVFVGLSGPNNTRVRKYLFLGHRAKIRFSATQAALNLLRLRLLELMSNERV